MPKLVRSRNYHSLPVQSPSSALPTTLQHVKQAQHVNCILDNSSSSSIPFLSSYSPMTPPWDTSAQQDKHQQKRKVSDEDMYQNHRTSMGSSIDTENRDTTSSNSSISGYDGDIHLPSSSSSSSASTTTLKRRKPSVCLTDLVQHGKRTVCAAISPNSTSIDHRDKLISDIGGSSPSECWGHFTTTTNEDSFAIEVDDQNDDAPYTFLLNEDCWDYNAMAHATSFVPIKQRPYHANIYTAHSSTYRNQSSYGSVVNASPCTLNGGTSWRVALSSTINHYSRSRNTQFDHHNHPYRNANCFPTTTRQKIISSVSQQPSMNRFNNECDEQQQESLSRQLQSSSSSSSFNEFILTVPQNFRGEKNTDNSMDIATQRMSVLGL